jgi:hypothetical protein
MPSTCATVAPRRWGVISWLQPAITLTVTRCHRILVHGPQSWKWLELTRSSSVRACALFSAVCSTLLNTVIFQSDCFFGYFTILNQLHMLHRGKWEFKGWFWTVSFRVWEGMTAVCLMVQSKRSCEVGCEVLTTVGVRIRVFRDLPPCNFTDEYQFAVSIFRRVEWSWFYCRSSSPPLQG